MNNELNQRIEQRKKDIEILQKSLEVLLQQEKEQNNWVIALSNDRAILNLSILTPCAKQYLIDAISEGKNWASFCKGGYFGIALNEDVFYYYKHANVKKVF